MVDPASGGTGNRRRRGHLEIPYGGVVRVFFGEKDNMKMTPATLPAVAGGTAGVVLIPRWCRGWAPSEPLHGPVQSPCQDESARRATREDGITVKIGRSRRPNV